MAHQLQKLTGAWTTDVLPTQTTLTHIDPTNIHGIVSTLLSASAAYPTVTERVDLYHLARAVKGAKASLSVVSAQNYIATATDTQELPKMTSVIWNATMELQDLEMGFNLYQMKLSMSANTIFAVCFALLMAMHTGLFVWKQYLYFGFCLVIGASLEFAGYVARTSSIGNYSDKAPFICQVICLTLAPAVIMAGIYYLLAQLLVIYGRQYSKLKPLWFSYIFILCDALSLIIQAAGGGLAAIKLQNLESTDTGTNIMVTGIAIQVVSMTLFVYLLCDFLRNVYFRASPEVRFSVATFFDLLFQTERGRTIQTTFLHKTYDPSHRKIWSRASFGYMPLVILISVGLIYVRCIYRLVELSEGWTGYLITHEEYVMTLDGLLVLITCIMYIPFHPGFMMGRGNGVPMREQPTQLSEEAAFSDSDSSVEIEKYDYDSQHGPIDPYYVPRMDTSEYSAPENPFGDEKASDFSSPDVTAAEAAKDMPSGISRNDHLSGENGKSFAFWKSKPKPSHAVEEGGLVAIPYSHTHSTRESMVSVPATFSSGKKKTRKSKNRQPLTETSSLHSMNPYTKPATEAEELKTSPYEQFNGHQQGTFSCTPREQNTPISGTADHHNIHWEVFDKFSGTKRDDKPDRDFSDVMSQFTTDEFFFSFGTKR